MTSNPVIHAQKRFINHMNVDKARINLLTKYWNETKEKMLLQMIKAKKEGKKVKALQQMSNEMRDAVLSRYYQKCKRKHAALYFEWRKKRRRIKIKKCVELLCYLRKKDGYIDDVQRNRLMSFGIEGLAQIEEKRLKYEDRPPIESLAEID